jgi:Protein of unknown function (DUF3618)
MSHPTPSDPSPEDRHGVEQADRPRSREEMRADNAELREELGATVEELARRVDVPARAKAWRDETLEQARTRGAQAWSDLATRYADLRRRVEPKQAAALGGVALFLLVVLVRRRRKVRRRKRG